MLERRVVHVPDVRADPEYHYVEQIDDFRAILGVPLLRESVPIGVIIISRTDARPFTARQIDLVTTFADQAVIAIENVRLLQELQARNRDLTEALEQQTATSEVLKVINSSPTELQPVLDVVAENATRLCDATSTVIWRLDGDLLQRAAVTGRCQLRICRYLSVVEQSSAEPLLTGKRYMSKMLRQNLILSFRRPKLFGRRQALVPPLRSRCCERVFPLE